MADGDRDNALTYPPIITHVEANALLDVLRAGAAEAEVSLDLGLTRSTVVLRDGAALLGGAAIDAPALRKAARDERKCFEVADGALRQIAVFSDTTHWARSLCPTSGAPTTLVAGFPMHRMKGTDPMADTRTKVRALGAVGGRVLDTATGLGYTAIELARTAREVVTIELDPSAIELARRNPWSRGLFEQENITLVTGDILELIDGFKDGEFDAVLHDPPSLKLAGDLYSGEFYGRLRRVLRPGGRLFHYVGDPDSGAGATVTRGVIRRLTDAGFRNVTRRPEAFGVVAVG